jgi:hypothetical protein
MKEYTGAIYTTAKDMYQVWPLAKMLYASLDADMFRRYIDNTIADIRLEMRVVFHESKPIAFAVTHRTPVMFLCEKKCISIAHIAVEEKHRPQVSAFVVQWIEHDAKKDGVGAIDVRSQKSNIAADKYYTKNDFINTESFGWRTENKGETLVTTNVKAALRQRRQSR